MGTQCQLVTGTCLASPSPPSSGSPPPPSPVARSAAALPPPAPASVTAVPGFPGIANSGTAGSSTPTASGTSSTPGVGAGIQGFESSPTLITTVVEGSAAGGTGLGLAADASEYDGASVNAGDLRAFLANSQSGIAGATRARHGAVTRGPPYGEAGSFPG